MLFFLLFKFFRCVEKFLLLFRCATKLDEILQLCKKKQLEKSRDVLLFTGPLFNHYIIKRINQNVETFFSPFVLLSVKSFKCCFHLMFDETRIYHLCSLSLLLITIFICGFPSRFLFSKKFG